MTSSTDIGSDHSPRKNGNPHLLGEDDDSPCPDVGPGNPNLYGAALDELSEDLAHPTTAEWNALLSSAAWATHLQEDATLDVGDVTDRV